jgi:hypothetical protein
MNGEDLCEEFHCVFPFSADRRVGQWYTAIVVQIKCIIPVLCRVAGIYLRPSWMRLELQYFSVLN